MISNNVASRHAQTQRKPHSPPPPQAQKPQTTPSQQPNSHRKFNWQAKALTRLRLCAGWSKALLVAHNTLSEITCTGSDIIYRKKQKANKSKAKQSKPKSRKQKTKLGTTQRASTSKAIPSPEQSSELRVRFCHPQVVRKTVPDPGSLGPEWPQTIPCGVYS